MPVSASLTRHCYYGTKARVYDEKNSASDKRLREEATLESMLTRQRNGLLLDCPVGTGHFIPMYSRLGFEIVGVDVSCEMLQQANGKGDAQLIQGDIFNLQLHPKSVDVSVCVRFLTLIQTDEMALALRSLSLVTRDSIVCSIKTADQGSQDNRSVTHSTKEWHEAISRAGLRLIESQPIRADYQMVELQCA